uniref:Uncharacterized protein n=1 Tax=Nelumbo nucifera TaxID=4432 RepID=A0A822ZN47_NELNU|nr:TPA_asm: hypothetical protein HUJ06_004130 [Nelumbo nucifera]
MGAHHTRPNYITIKLFYAFLWLMGPPSSAKLAVCAPRIGRWLS